MPGSTGGGRTRKDFLGGLRIGRSGSVIKKAVASTVSINPASIGATTRVGTTFTVTGAATGDMILMSPPTGLNDDLLFVGAKITATDTATVYLYNPTGGGIDDGALTWEYLWLDLT